MLNCEEMKNLVVECDQTVDFNYKQVQIEEVDLKCSVNANMLQKMMHFPNLQRLVVNSEQHLTLLKLEGQQKQFMIQNPEKLKIEQLVIACDVNQQLLQQLFDNSSLKSFIVERDQAADFNIQNVKVEEVELKCQINSNMLIKIMHFQNLKKLKFNVNQKLQTLKLEGQHKQFTIKNPEKLQIQNLTISTKISPILLQQLLTISCQQILQINLDQQIDFSLQNSKIQQLQLNCKLNQNFLNELISIPTLQKIENPSKCSYEKLLVSGTFRNAIEGFEQLQIGEIEIRSKCSDEFVQQLLINPGMKKISDPHNYLSKRICVAKCPLTVIELPEIEKLELKCGMDQNLLESVLNQNLSEHPHFESVTYVFGKKSQSVPLEQLEKTKVLRFYKANIEVIQNIPFDKVQHQIDVEVVETDMRHLKLDYLMGFDLNVKVDCKMLGDRAVDGRKLKKTRFERSGQQLLLKSSDVSQLSKYNWFSSLTNITIDCQLTDAAVELLKKNTEVELNLDFLAEQECMRQLSDFGFNVLLGGSKWGKCSTWTEKSRITVFDGSSPDFVQRPTIADLESFTFQNTVVEPFFGRIPRLERPKLFLTQGTKITQDQLSALRNHFAVEEVSHLVLDEKCPADKFCSTVQSLKAFDEITVKNHKLSDYHRDDFLQLLVHKRLNITTKESITTAVRNDIENYQITLRINGRELPQTMHYRDGELELNPGYSIRHVLERQFFRSLKKIRLCADIQTFLGDDPFVFRQPVQIVTNQVLSTLQVESLNNLNCEVQVVQTSSDFSNEVEAAKQRLQVFEEIRLQFGEMDRHFQEELKQLKEDVVRVCEEEQLVWQNMDALLGCPVPRERQKVVQHPVEGADFELESTNKTVSRSRDQQWEQVQRIRLMCARHYERIKGNVMEFADFK